MYYAVTFVAGSQTYNTYTNWYMVPSSRPVIQPPKPKKTMIDIPGSNNRIDLTETLAGDVTYSNRTGSLEFIVLNDKPMTWYEVYNDVMNTLHGRRVQIRLEEEPDWYYEGRVEVNNWASNEDYSRITIDYDLEPFKYQTTPVTQTYTLTNTETTIYFPYGFRAPTLPKFTLSGVNASCELKYESSTFTLQSGEQPIPSIWFSDNETYYFQVKGSGTLTIMSRGGKL